MTAATEHSSVLRDPEAQHRLDEVGYVAIPFLDPGEHAQLVNDYTQLTGTDDDALAIDYLRDDRSIMRKVSELLEPMFENHLATAFYDYTPIINTFITKHPGEASTMLMHHEPTYVDESQYRTYNIWIPLTEITHDPPNGGVQLIPGTENICPPYSGLNSPVLFRQYEEFLRRHLVDVEVPLGHGLVYDTHMLHASGPNLSDAPRPAIACALAPRGARLVHTLATGRRSRDIYAVDREFFLRAHPQDLEASLVDQYELIDTVTTDFDLTPSMVATAVGDPNPPPATCITPDDLGDIGDGADAQLLGTHTVIEYGATIDLHLAEDSVHPGSCDGVTITGSDLLWGLPQPSARTALRSAGSSLELRDGDLLAVLHPGGRMWLELSPEQSATTATVVDVTQTAAGHVADGHPTQLELGQQLTLGDGRHCLWNNGPGPAVVAVRPAQLPSSPLADGPPPRRTVRDRLRRLRRN